MKRFAFYGRVSTEGQQDPASSRNWQLARSRQIIEPDGEIVAELDHTTHRGAKLVLVDDRSDCFCTVDTGDDAVMVGEPFDRVLDVAVAEFGEGFSFGEVDLADVVVLRHRQSRSLPWKRRPEAARLLDAFRDLDRGFDADVVGEPQRAFYGNQFGLTFPVFTHFGVELWVPEVGGPVDPGSEAHDMVMSLYGGMIKGERMRIKTRVRSAMAAQAAIEGRFLGGRPPYGYQLIDAGPHPTRPRPPSGSSSASSRPIRSLRRSCSASSPSTPKDSACT